jgi:transposase-like protein
MTFDLTAPMFKDEAAAIAHMEADRWPHGAICPLCGSDNVHKMGGATQAGMFVCYACDGKFTVRTGTVFERSHIPLHKWLLAIYLMGSSKKGISAHQLHRMLDITYKSAWFMAHRIREAMAPAKSAAPIGGKGKVVEADETFLQKKSGKRKHRGAGGYAHKIAVLSLVERGGAVRSKMIDGANRGEIYRAVRDTVDPESVLHTDGAQFYKFMGLTADHEAVDHSKTYARKGKHGKVHTNSAEGYFSVFKRGLIGTYQHIGEQHVDRYLAEFDFRANNRAKLGVTDDVRAERILKGAEGKRLTYRQNTH